MVPKTTHNLNEILIEHLKTLKEYDEKRIK
jgi:hypothetical protein